MVMDDAIKATLQLMQADESKLSVRSSYNLSAVSFTPEELADSIKTHLPDFSIDYKPDFRQAIADSWPDSIDDSDARADWGWSHDFGLSDITSHMLSKLRRSTIA